MARVEHALDRAEFFYRQALAEAVPFAHTAEGALVIASATTALRAVATERACLNASDDDDLDALIDENTEAHHAAAEAREALDRYGEAA